ncbi:hypothetical protein E2C01_004507 [Portunus trituberculatus]|uniref:Uncharacterized protein n=1 Tax=Portunus trituberculatus TaxID=210409 RepID=A0A5B7CSI4_PORTR|nr:hypothetical protein [Portunus trituberculatus]
MPLCVSSPGLCRTPPHPVGGLIRRFLEECLQLTEPAPLLTCYTGLESTPHFQLLRSVAKEWSYCRNATQNYTSMGGSSKRQRATSRLIETFESIDSLRTQLAHYMHQVILLEMAQPGTVAKVCRAEMQLQQHHQQASQQASQQGEGGQEGGGGSNSTGEPALLDLAELTSQQWICNKRRPQTDGPADTGRPGGTAVPLCCPSDLCIVQEAAGKQKASRMTLISEANAMEQKRDGVCGGTLQYGQRARMQCSS